MEGWRNYTRQFFRDRYGILIVILLIFLLGVAGGCLGANKMPVEKREQLSVYLDGRWNEFTEQPVDRVAMLEGSVIRNLEITAAIWFLGLTVIGIPFIAGLVAFRGFILGFTVGFLVEQMSWQGVILSLLGILPHNLIAVPTLIAAAALGVSFSMELVRGRISIGFGGMGRMVLGYTTTMLALTAVMAAAGLTEGILSPSLIRLLNTLMR
ncbi:MAG: stage II sporulation protein M [Firmicutes bacterium]|nr:stage II sporulation protein M [Bacillota bacterium]